MAYIREAVQAQHVPLYLQVGTLNRRALQTTMEGENTIHFIIYADGYIYIYIYNFIHTYVCVFYMVMCLALEWEGELCSGRLGFMVFDLCKLAHHNIHNITKR